jgi:ABC-2 type transport system ATP-binding protein
MKAELLAALLHQPQVLFLDEPTLGLDVNAQVSVREFLKDYNKRYGATVLLTSHYMADITALCQRVLVIYEGQMIYDGSLDGLLETFAPCRAVNVLLAYLKTTAALQTYGDLSEVSGRVAHFIVPQEKLTHTLSRILAELDVVDLTVAEPPIEEIIGQIFRSGAVG